MVLNPLLIVKKHGKLQVKFGHPKILLPKYLNRLNNVLKRELLTRLIEP